MNTYNESRILARIEGDLAAARSEGRFGDVIECLDELVPFQMHSEDQAVRDRCAAILRGELVGGVTA